MNNLEVTLKLLIKDAICEALDEYTTKIKPANESDVASNATPPGTRKRRTKAEMVLDVPEQAGLEVVEETIGKGPLIMPKADPAAEYKKIQELVVAMVGVPGGKEKVVSVLDQFGVPTALKLTTDQYPEALALLQAAMNEPALA